MLSGRTTEMSAADISVATMTTRWPLDKSGPAAVYRIHDPGPGPLYIGLTQDLAKRLDQHARHSAWWPLAEVRHTVEWFATWDDAAFAEAIAIAVERPRHNRRRDRYRLVAGRWVDLATAARPVPIAGPT